MGRPTTITNHALENEIAELRNNGIIDQPFKITNPVE